MNNLTELVFILDRSGSMAGLESDTIGGFNAMLKKQQSEVEGDALVSTILFDHESIVLHDRVPLAEVQPLTAKDYQVRGTTALLDAVELAGHIGIDARRAVNYHSDGEGTAQVFGAIANFSSHFRAASPERTVDDDAWREEIDEDFRSRK